MKDQTSYIITIVFLFFSFASFNSDASLIPGELEITGNVSFNASSLPALGGATQTATLKSVLGGLSETSSINGLAVSGTDSQGGLLQSINDGVGAVVSISGDEISSSEGFFFNFLFSLSNTSLTDSLQISFELEFENTTSASGNDAYTDAEITLKNQTNNEIFFSDLTSDTLFGDSENGVPLSTSGATLTDAGTFLFDFILSANSSSSFNGEIKLDAESFVNNGAFSANTSAFIRVIDVENLTEPVNSVPSPSTLSILLLAMMCFAVKQKYRKEQ